MDLLDCFEELLNDEPSRQDCIKAPFGWPGGKSKSIDKILPYLPYYQKYVEVFGGSGAILLARTKSKLEVYNDRFGGVCDFYRCLHNKDLWIKLKERLVFILHSREMFYLCRDTWENTMDPVERAARWYYSIIYSFGAKGKTFGRGNIISMAGKHLEHLEEFFAIHKRLQDVLIENLDFRLIFKDFDSYDTVFYCDPPYMGTYNTAYKHEMTYADHQDLLGCIFNCKGFVALSGYPNELYDAQPWDNRVEWDQYVSIGLGSKEGNNKKDPTERGARKECLWIKEAR